MGPAMLLEEANPLTTANLAPSTVFFLQILGTIPSIRMGHDSSLQKFACSHVDLGPFAAKSGTTREVVEFKYMCMASLGMQRNQTVWFTTLERYSPAVG